MEEFSLLKVPGIVRLILKFEDKVISVLLDKCYLKIDNERKRLGLYQDFILRGKIKLAPNQKENILSEKHMTPDNIHQLIVINKPYHVDRSVFEYDDEGDTIIRVDGCMLEVN